MIAGRLRDARSRAASRALRTDVLGIPAGYGNDYYRWGPTPPRPPPPLRPRHAAGGPRLRHGGVRGRGPHGPPRVVGVPRPRRRERRPDGCLRVPPEGPRGCGQPRDRLPRRTPLPLRGPRRVRGAGRPAPPDGDPRGPRGPLD